MDDVAPQIKDSMFEDQLRSDTPDLLGTCVSIMNNDITKFSCRFIDVGKASLFEAQVSFLPN